MEMSGWDLGTDIGPLFWTLETVPRSLTYGPRLVSAALPHPAHPPFPAQARTHVRNLENIGSHATRFFECVWKGLAGTWKPSQGSQPNLSKHIKTTLGVFYFGGL